jgi:hypothetical protein
MPAALAAAALGWPGIGNAQLAIHVQGNQLVNQNGAPIRLHGVDYDGTEYTCVGGGGGTGNGTGVFAGPSDQSTVTAMRTWQINAVRVPLNETCWLGTNTTVNSQYAGVNYQTAIASFVQLLTNAGIYVILDMHWAHPGTTSTTANIANGQTPMADADNSGNFWFSVATYFKDNPAVIFDLFNEPYIELGGETTNPDIGPNVGTADDWSCWENATLSDGTTACTIPAGSGHGTTWPAYTPAGMQQMLNKVRAAGATQPVMLGGEFYTQDPSQWLSHVPTDETPNGWQGGQWIPQIIADYHRYGSCSSQQTCQTQFATDQQYTISVLQTIGQSYPVVAGEFGEHDCATNYVYTFMDSFDQNGFSYLGFSWNNLDCGSIPSLLAATTGTNQDYYSATPSGFGQGVKDHYLALYRLHDTHDFSSDGVSDVLWRNTSTADVAIWLMSNGQFSSGIDLGAVPSVWAIVATRDFNGDGTADILWRNTTTGDLGIWLMSNGHLSSSIDLGAIPTVWSVVGTGDFNSDGTADILWRNTSTGDLAIWLMSSGQVSSSIDLGVVDTAWSVVGAGDFNNDGTTDIFWRNSSSGALAIWLMSSGQLSSSVSLGTVASTWSVVGTGDVNNDGTSDILWRNSSSTDVAIWLMSNGQLSSSVNLGAVANTWSVAGTGDFDGNGTADILWLDTAGDLGIWFMNGSKVSSTTSFGNVGATWQVQGQNAD